jgi:transcription elongation factor Elf1
MTPSLLGDLNPEEKIEVYEAFINKCQELRKSSDNQIISYGIALDMLTNIAIEKGFFKCPTCGHKGVRKP